MNISSTSANSLCQHLYRFKPPQSPTTNQQQNSLQNQKYLENTNKPLSTSPTYSSTGTYSASISQISLANNYIASQANQISHGASGAPAQGPDLRNNHNNPFVSISKMHKTNQAPEPEIVPLCGRNSILNSDSALEYAAVNNGFNINLSTKCKNALKELNSKQTIEMLANSNNYTLNYYHNNHINKLFLITTKPYAFDIAV